jgi:hypothetical protein
MPGIASHLHCQSIVQYTHPLPLIIHTKVMGRCLLQLLCSFISAGKPAVPQGVWGATLQLDYSPNNQTLTNSQV